MNIKLTFLFAFCLLITPLSYAQRYALVIGNSNYGAGIGVLKNPVNDAKDMSAMLTKKQFKVTTLTNANKRQMKQGIAAFTKKLNEKNAVGLFFYAGHGVEVAGRNYLIPLGVTIEGEGDVEFEAIDAGRVMGGMEVAGNNLNMVILDACRNNPFSRSFRSASRGLARMDPPKGSLILYATSPGDVASDGKGRNGLFTQHLLKAMNTPGITVEKVFKTTANKVYKSSNKKQLPWQSGVMLGDFYFTINAVQAETVSINPVESNSNQAEIIFWDGIKNETTPDFFRSYLSQYPEGLYAQLAKIKIQRDGKIVVVEPPKPPQQTTAHLTIKSSPDNAKIRILNIVPRFQQGMELKPGRYHIEISKTGYKRHTEWIELSKEGKVHSVVLTAQSSAVSVPVKPQRQSGNQPAMANIAAGCFQMGSPSWENDRDDDERQHRVCVDTFRMGLKEVTKAEFRQFVRATGYRTEAEKNIQKKGCYAYSSSANKWDWRAGKYWDNVGFNQNEQHPVVCVSWNDIQHYISWLNSQSTGGYRLPTEAEWEYAARGGTQTPYFWGSAVDAKACKYGNVDDKNWSNKFPCNDGYKYTTPVGRYRANNFGLYDISGNVWEWTCSEYDKNYKGGEKQCLGKNNASNGDLLVARGGSFNDTPRRLRMDNRYGYWPWERLDHWGFRLARTN
jgi:formylglycine-generating enzyme required for sulfatase activity